MPWRGPSVAGEFPTLGYLMAEWMEDTLVVPDRDAIGQPFRLTDEQLHFVLWYYRLKANRLVLSGQMRGTAALQYYGAQLMRPQKWGKDPLMGAVILGEGLGPAVPDGFDANGEPVGRPATIPLIQVAAMSDDQTDNTFRPIYRMITEGPLVNLHGMDAGITRINLPSGGLIEPVTSAAKSRLGAPISFGGFTETHLMTRSSGGVAMAKAMKRNLDGMDGRWMEATNAYDPTEKSVAQLTAESKAPGVYIDYRPPRTHVDLDDVAAMKAELEYVYGDSMQARGGWVRGERILEAAKDTATGPAEVRRFFLNEITAGSEAFIDPFKWATAQRDDDPLANGDMIAIGFDGSRNDDMTIIAISRIRDGRLFAGGDWGRPKELPAEDEWHVPRVEVDSRLVDIFEAYRVVGFHGDPWKWQDYLDVWAGRWGSELVLEFDTSQQRRMDKAIARFRDALRNGELTHDGGELLTQHLADTVVVNGNRKSSREDGDTTSTHYLKLAKKKSTVKIDAAVAAVLAHEARAWALEHGAWEAELAGPGIYIFGDDDLDDDDLDGEDEQPTQDDDTDEE